MKHQYEMIYNEVLIDSMDLYFEVEMEFKFGGHTL